MSDSDKARTEAANLLYANAVRIAQTTQELGVSFCNEKPFEQPHVKNITFFKAVEKGARILGLYTLTIVRLVALVTK